MNSIIRLLIILLLASSSSALFSRAAQAEETPDTPALIETDLIDHAPFEALLTRFVDPKGMVDYAAWHADRSAREALEGYIDALGRANPQGYSQNSRLAFYLNAYNALTIQDVLNRWPISTVIDIKGFFDGKEHLVAGQKMTLDGLEHTEIIRAQFQEPRIHFVLVCAARDCPRLLQKPMTAQNLEAQLQAATVEFVNRATRQVGENKIETSSLFDWYAQDFVNDAGSVAAYLARYITDKKLRRLLQKEDLQISFSEYDWALNQRKSEQE